MEQSKGKLAEVFPPGDMLQEKLAELGMPVKEFALRCGKPEPTIHDVLKGRSGVTSDMAILFERVLGIPARVWLNLQCQYDEYRARCRYDEEMQRDSGWAKQFPFSEMVSKGYFPGRESRGELDRLNTLLDFFGFAKVGIWEKFYLGQALKAESRISLAGIPNAYILSAWLRYGENKVALLSEMPTYAKKKLRRKLPEMRALANRGGEDFLPSLTEHCRRAGVVLVCTPKISDAKVVGATRWYKDTPLVQVADSFQRYDQFWFTFFHEIGHILYHGKRKCFLEGVEYPRKQSEEEEEADDFAGNCLVPKAVANRLVSVDFSKCALDKFCQEEHIHMAFAVAFLQQMNRIGKSDDSWKIPAVDFTRGK